MAFFVSFFVTLLILFTKKWHEKYTNDQVHGIQKIHVINTPRIGGLAIFISVGISKFFIDINSEAIVSSLWCAGSIIFAIGFIEDILKRVTVGTRFTFSIIAGVLICLITGISLTSLGLPFDNYIMGIKIISIIISALAMSGIANAFNLIDGLNGLTGTVLIIAFTTIALISFNINDQPLAVASFTMAAAMGGFLVFNWPFPKIFLGDGGAYFCGFSLAWLSILLVERNKNVSPFAALLICIYPFSEAIFTIYRRKIKLFKLTKPDRLHLHTIIYRRSFFLENKLITKNSITGFFVGSLSLPPAIAAYFFYLNNTLMIILCILFSGLFIMIYKYVINFKLGNYVRRD